MIGTNITFTREKNGYDREQVDSYIKKVSDAYQTTYYEYLDINSKYSKLVEEREKAGAEENQERPGMNSEIAAKTLINTEMLAQKIIADAQAEATAVIDESRKSIADAQAEAAALKEEARKIISEAEAEAEEIKETARRILNEANSRAEMKAGQLRKDMARARKIMEQASGEVEALLAFHEDEEDYAEAA